jgi:uncharacterized membrane protein YphA (DoxX/SURF4 family)
MQLSTKSRTRLASASALARIDQQVTVWLARHSVSLVRISLGVVFLLFGVLKFVPGASPAEDMATRVMSDMTLGLIPDWLCLVLVAAMESTIGLSLVTGRYLKVGLSLLGMAIVGIMAPLVLFPQDLLTNELTPTIEGQYVFKDIVLAAAALPVFLRERGARFVLGHRPDED